MAPVAQQGRQALESPEGQYLAVPGIREGQRNPSPPVGREAQQGRGGQQPQPLPVARQAPAAPVDPHLPEALAALAALRGQSPLAALAALVALVAQHLPVLPEALAALVVPVAQQGREVWVFLG